MSEFFKTFHYSANLLYQGIIIRIDTLESGQSVNN